MAPKLLHKLDGWAPADLPDDQDLAGRLLPLCAAYLVRARRDGQLLDPVARFHLRNGARLERINWAADLSSQGLAGSAGIMVDSILYRLDQVERNHEDFVNKGRVVSSRRVDALVRSLPADMSATLEDASATASSRTSRRRCPIRTGGFSTLPQITTATAFSIVRDNADRVPYLGYDPFWYKLLAYIMAAQIAAFGGLIYPLLRGFVAPHLFGFEVSTKAVVMSLVGGVGTLLGPLIGSVIITFVESFVGSYTERHLIVLGVIFIVFVLFLPDGLCGLARRLFASGRKAGAMIKVTELNKAFGALKAVNDLSFEAAAHRITSIIGPNGAGKSTAFNLIAGTLRPNSGRVELAGRDVTGRTPYMLSRLGIARSFQITNLFFGLSVFENIRLACQSLEQRSSYLVRIDRLIAPRARAARDHRAVRPHGQCG